MSIAISYILSPCKLTLVILYSTSLRLKGSSSVTIIVFGLQVCAPKNCRIFGCRSPCSRYGCWYLLKTLFIQPVTWPHVPDSWFTFRDNPDITWLLRIQTMLFYQGFEAHAEAHVVTPRTLDLKLHGEQVRVYTVAFEPVGTSSCYFVRISNDYRVSVDKICHCRWSLSSHGLPIATYDCKF